MTRWSALYLQLWVNSSSDFITARISWIVNVSDCLVHFHFAFVKCASWWNEAAAGWDFLFIFLPLTPGGAPACQSRFFPTRVEELNPLQRELPGLLHHVVYVRPHHAVGLRTSFYCCTEVSKKKKNNFSTVNLRSQSRGRRHSQKPCFPTDSRE